MTPRGTPTSSGSAPTRQEIIYEDLAAHAEPVVRQVLDYLDLPVPADLAVAAPSLSIQADEVSEQWVRIVHEHVAALEEAEPESL